MRSEDEQARQGRRVENLFATLVQRGEIARFPHLIGAFAAPFGYNFTLICSADRSGTVGDHGLVRP
jgi:hypothetical protein